MNEVDVFEGWDVEWLAVDADGYLAVFTVAHGRPMPESFRDEAVLDQTWDFIRALPVRGEAELLAQLPRPDDYVAFAERGLFAFDWTDFHRVRSAEIHRYEMIARPRSPVRLVDLAPPRAVRDAIWNARAMRFSESREMTPPREGFQF